MLLHVLQQHLLSLLSLAVLVQLGAAVKDAGATVAEEEEWQDDVERQHLGVESSAAIISLLVGWVTAIIGV